MSGEEAWHAIGIQIHPQGDQWGCSPHMLLNQFWQIMSSWTSLCADEHDPSEQS